MLRASGATSHKYRLLLDWQNQSSRQWPTMIHEKQGSERAIDKRLLGLGTQISKMHASIPGLRDLEGKI